jgi:hypothetical protein
LAAAAQETQLLLLLPLLLPQQQQLSHLLTCQQPWPMQHQLQKQAPQQLLLLLCALVRRSSLALQAKCMLCLCHLKHPMQRMLLQHV